MKANRSRAVAVGAAVIMGAASLGCGVVSQVKQVVDTATVLGDFAEQLGAAAGMTYTAEYQVTGGEKVTLVQQPPNAAYLGVNGRFIFTPEHLLICEEQHCQRSPNQHTEMDAATGGMAAAVAGGGLITPEMALGLVAAAAFVPGAKVKSSDKTIAGQKSRCAEVTELEALNDDTTAETFQDFSVCITDKGVLASFTGTSTTGEEGAVELISFQESADPAAFEPPAGATVTDVGELPQP